MGCEALEQAAQGTIPGVILKTCTWHLKFDLVRFGSARLIVGLDLNVVS